MRVRLWLCLVLCCVGVFCREDVRSEGTYLYYDSWDGGLLAVFLFNLFVTAIVLIIFYNLRSGYGAQLWSVESTEATSLLKSQSVRGSELKEIDIHKNQQIEKNDEPPMTFPIQWQSQNSSIQRFLSFWGLWGPNVIGITKEDMLTNAGEDKKM
jgi:hypothetical protein